MHSNTELNVVWGKVYWGFSNSIKHDSTNHNEGQELSILELDITTVPAYLVIAMQVDDYIFEREPSLVTESTQHVPQCVPRLGGHQAAGAIREVHIAVLFCLPWNGAGSTSWKQVSIP